MPRLAAQAIYLTVLRNLDGAVAFERRDLSGSEAFFRDFPELFRHR